MAKKTIFTSILVILLCLSLTVGGTFALFATESKVNLAISLGKVDVYAYVDGEPTLSSLYGGNVPETKVVYDETTNKIDVINMIPGDKIDFSISIVDRSTISAQFQTALKIVDQNGELYNGLVIDVGGLVLQNTGEAKTDFMPIPDATEGEPFYTVPISVYMPMETVVSDTTNITIVFSVIAIQGNIYMGPQAQIDTFEEENLPDYKEDISIKLGGGKVWNIDWPAIPEDVEVEAAWTFKTLDTAETVESSVYKDWICDFIIECDQNIEIGELGLIGKYNSWEDGDWLGFANPMPLSNEQALPMLSSTLTKLQGVAITYEMICKEIVAFDCGVFRGLAGDSMNGKTITVSLVLIDSEYALGLIEDLIVNQGMTEDQAMAEIMNISKYFEWGKTIQLVNKTSYKFE